MTGDTTTNGDKATTLAARDAARQEAEERQAALTRGASFGAALLITAGLVASVWYGRMLAGPAPVSSSPSAFPAQAAAPGFSGSGRAGFASAARRPAMYTPPSSPFPLVPVSGAPADQYVTPLRRLVDEVNRSDVARYWQGGDHSGAGYGAGGGASPAQVLTAVDALESLTTLITHPRRYPPELRPYTQTVSLELRNYLKVTAFAAGTGERSGDLQVSATRHLDRCNQAITRLDAVARGLASGSASPPDENAVLP